MNETNKTEQTLLGRVFGGVKMTWPRVLLLAVGSAVITFLFLVLPIFENTSFHLMGEYLEAWILLAVFIMANCKSPLDSALKTFVFFLVSQPLIYLLQVPFTSLGWQIFQFYRFWFYWTLATFPMAFVGWYITKRNWISLLILAPVLAFLAYTGSNYLLKTTIHQFPRYLLAVLLCWGQIVLYLLAFTFGKLQKAAGLAIALAVLVFCLATNVGAGARDLGLSLMTADFAPNAEVEIQVENADLVRIDLVEAGPITNVKVNMDQFGQTTFTLTDGRTSYRYYLSVYKDADGQVKTSLQALSD